MPTPVAQAPGPECVMPGLAEVRWSASATYGADAVAVVATGTEQKPVLLSMYRGSRSLAAIARIALP